MKLTRGLVGNGEGARYWIEKLGLMGHPEGGLYAPVYRSPEILGRERLPERFPGARPVVSSIYFLLEKGAFSAFHRIKSVEIWNFCAGSPLTVYVIDPDGNLSAIKIGANFEAGELFQAAVEPGSWFAAELAAGAASGESRSAAGPAGPGGFSLVTCTVAPGFDFEDFELARRDELASLYPRHGKLIERLTRA